MRLSFAAAAKQRQPLLLSLLHPAEENERGAIAGLLADSALQVCSDTTVAAVWSRA
ncbi:hypothetical protein [Thermosynechococcus sp.]|uniref:hypothetical protein n=1 Tax=Thermosynechococcus sp. TaxID=2814275 RepID=UPI002623BBFF|nr:hypothetical protein [Thermosynechococcus sp.]